MTHHTAARRYARALFDVALKEQADLSRMESDLAGFAGLLEKHQELRKVLLNPAMPAPRKRAIVAELMTHGSLAPVVAKLLVLLGERDRLILLPDILTAYRDRLMDHQKIVRADVTTASPLPADRATQIQQSLARATGRTVRLSTHVDPTIIGGIVARIGSLVYDASVTNHLQRMKQRLQESL